jgi:RNA polymerase sigma factor (TIGR02999 family)
MRSIVVDHARARSADKRGGGAQRVTLTDSLGDGGSDLIDVLELDQALTRLATQDARGSEVLHLTYFAGLRQDEIAELYQVSTKTIERDLRFARAWLHEALRG